MKTAFAALSLVCCISLTGCSSLVYTTSLDKLMCDGITSGGSRDCSAERYKTFIGTRKNVENIRDTDWPARLLFLVDAPLSAVLDVVFLVYTIPRDLLER